MHNVLLLEDDHSYRASIQLYLEIQAYNVDTFDIGNEALDAIFEKKYDLLLLDIRVPGATGYEIAKIVRENSIDIPIIFISSLVDVEHLSKGYELGCDDYIRKPFSLKELRCRIEQSLNMYNFHSHLKQIKLPQNFLYDVEKNELFKDGISILLTKTERKIISFLVQRRGLFSNIFQIIECLWKDEFVSEANVRMHIKRIRAKSDVGLIVNAKGLGYKIEKI